MEKFEPVVSLLLKKRVNRNSLDGLRLDFYRSKLNLEDHKTDVFDILNELYYCDCCDKHQIGKPCIPVKWISHEIPTQNNFNCSCDCRHTARMICRMCD